MVYLHLGSINRCRMPVVSHKRLLTALIRSRTGVWLLGTFTTNPAFWRIVRSVEPPAEVFLCRDAGSGYAQMRLFGYRLLISSTASWVLEENIRISSMTCKLSPWRTATTTDIGSMLKSHPVYITLVSYCSGIRTLCARSKL